MNKSFYFKTLFTFHFLLFTVSLLLSTVSRADTPASKLDEFLDGLETYSAAFEQQLFDESGEELEKSVGVFYMRRPGMFHWAYWEPYSQIIISDGVTLWIYDEDLEQVIIRDISNQIEDSPAAVLGGDVKINDHYLVIEQEEEDGINWIELTPRDIDSQYSAVRLGFRGEHLDKMQLYDNLGQTTFITFLDAKRNPPLDLELFSFTPPEGIDIIDNRN